jgi:prophage maintenance system killer protein
MTGRRVETNRIALYPLPDDRKPRGYAAYEDADLALQAAALAHGIAESQAFIDANKRLARSLGP